MWRGSEVDANLKTQSARTGIAKVGDWEWE